MADKYYLISHEVAVDKYALHSSVARPGMAINQADQYSRFDQQVETIRSDAETTSGVSPVFVSFSMPHGRSSAVLNWCLFNENSALTFAMLVSGNVSEHEWPEPMTGLSDEEILVKFFEVVATQFW